MKLAFKSYFPKGKSRINVDMGSWGYDAKKNMYIFELNAKDMRRQSQMYPERFHDMNDIVGLFDLFNVKKLVIKHFLDPTTGEENGGYIELYW